MSHGSKHHIWAQKCSQEKPASDPRKAFKPEHLSPTPICTHAERCWKEYLNQLCCSPWGSSSPASSKKGPGSSASWGLASCIAPSSDLESVARVGLTWILPFRVIPSFWGVGGQDYTEQYLLPLTGHGDLMDFFVSIRIKPDKLVITEEKSMVSRTCRSFR